MIRCPDKRSPAEPLPGSPAKIVLKSLRPVLIRKRESTFEIFCPDKTHQFPSRPLLGLPGVLEGCVFVNFKKVLQKVSYIILMLQPIAVFLLSILILSLIYLCFITSFSIVVDSLC